MKKNSVYDCSIIELDKHHHEKGNITVVENGISVPFSIKRVYYLYDVPGGTFIPVEVLSEDKDYALIMPLVEGVLTNGDRILIK